MPILEVIGSLGGIVPKDKGIRALEAGCGAMPV